MNNQKKYYYTRTKSIEIENGREILFLFAGLTEKQYQPLGKSIRKKVIPVFSKLIEPPLDQAPLYTFRIPIGTYTIEINKKEFETLLTEAQRDYHELFRYKLK